MLQAANTDFLNQLVLKLTIVSVKIHRFLSNEVKASYADFYLIIASSALMG